MAAGEGVETDRAPARAPSRLSQLKLRTWRGVFARALKGFMEDNCTDWAAALTYYGVLAIFPSAIVVVALVSLVANPQTALDRMLDIARQVAPGSVENIRGPLTEVINSRGSAKLLLSFGLLGAVWSASGYIGAFTRASNAIYEVKEGRKFYKLRPLQLALTALALLLLAVVAAALVFTGPLARAVGDALHIGDTLVTAWDYGKWPVLVFVVALLLSLMFWIAPNVRQPKFRWLTVGGAFALVAWAIVSLGFGLYVSNFSSYNATYGSLGAIIAFLVWLYLSNCAVMLGVEINAEVQRGRQIQAGDQDPQGPVLPPKAE
ncbi:MAG TPA: YihY/virulence factor BrkB family protein [Micromonosporaceae bacterium]|jgi:membrane protein